MVSAYRSDLDGMRALAVSAVILFHFDVSWAQGGYVGVDIFFVISGYLMTVMLWPERRPGIGEFYERRLRRLVPASYVVAMSVGIVVTAVASPVQMQAFTKQLTTSAAFVVNFLFWSENTYFANDLFRPLLHYWSLAVEVQYYVLFSLLIYVLRPRVGLLIVLFIASTLLSVLVTHASPKTAFFMLPTRLGEFLLGTFAYLVELRKPKLSQVTIFGVTVASMALIAMSIVTYSATTPFPHITALLPGIAAASLVVVGAMENNGASRIYGNRVMVSIGVRSYSIYLWHYPVSFLFREELERSPTQLEMLALLALIGLLSEVTYRCVEQPFRNPKRVSRRTAVLTWGIALSAIMAYAGISTLTSGFVGRYPKAYQDIYLSMQDREPYRCGRLARLLEPWGETCTLHVGGPHAPRVLLWGDSHADAIKPAVRAAASESYMTLLLNKRNCSIGRDEGECLSNRALLNEVANLEIDRVILHDEVRAFSRENWPRLKVALGRLTELGIKVAVLAPTPTFSLDIPGALISELETGKKQTALTMPVEDYRTSLQEFFAFKEDVEKSVPGIEFVDVTDVVCSGEVCNSHDQGTVFYFDSHHLTVSAAMKLRSKIHAIIND